MAQATKNRVGLPRGSQCPHPRPMAQNDGRAPSNVSNHTKKLHCLKLIYM